MRTFIVTYEIYNREIGTETTVIDRNTSNITISKHHNTKNIGNYIVNYLKDRVNSTYLTPIIVGLWEIKE